MFSYKIEYTTDLDDRITETIRGNSITEVYLTFIANHPKHYIITDIKELKNE